MFNLSHAFSTNFFIKVEQVDFLSVYNFNYIVDPYLVHLVNHHKINLVVNALVMELQLLNGLKNRKFLKYMIIWHG